MSAFLDRMHFFLGRSAVASRAAIKIRNQCDSILKYHLCLESNPAKNGEYLILDTLKGQIKSFCDVGANLGEYSNRLLQTMEIQQAYLFEPSKKCFAELKKRYSAKSFVQIENIAVSDTFGTGQFSFDDEAGETSSLVGVGKRSYKVEINTLDNVLYRIDLDLLKVDTEGYDLHVLKGSRSLLEQGKIRFIQFEYGPFWKYAGSTLYSCLQYLNALDYHVFRIDKNGLYMHDYEKFGEYFSYSNFFACRKEDIVHVRPLINK